MNPGLPVGRIAGVQVTVHWSWLIVFALITWTLAAAVFPGQNPGLSDGAYVGMALAASAIYFGALLLHEIGHALQARREQMEIDGITLWLFGGVAAFRGDFPSALAELRIALAGPLVTAVLTVAFALLAALGLPEAVDGVVTWLAVINLVLLAFNMLPALPLDGGRVLHALLWRWKDDRGYATAVGAGAGRAFAFLMIVGGLGLAVAGSGAGGIWLAFLGWFLLQAATSEQRSFALRDALGDLRVDDLMVHRPVTVPAHRTLEEFMDEVAHVHRFTTYPVVDDGTVVGLLPFARVAAAPRAGWGDHDVADCMIRLEDAPVVQAGTPLIDALAEMERQGGDRALVLDRGTLAGLLSITDVGRVMSEATARSGRPR
ncbi:MAG: site-2 protease family protein [Gaiella sp.]|nr:site-2 protease family protein [Gaiella sp.]